MSYQSFLIFVLSLLLILAWVQELRETRRRKAAEKKADLEWARAKGLTIYIAKLEKRIAEADMANDRQHLKLKQIQEILTPPEPKETEFQCGTMPADCLNQTDARLKRLQQSVDTYCKTVEFLTKGWKTQQS